MAIMGFPPWGIAAQPSRDKTNVFAVPHCALGLTADCMNDNSWFLRALPSKTARRAAGWRTGASRYSNVMTAVTTRVTGPRVLLQSESATNATRSQEHLHNLQLTDCMSRSWRLVDVRSACVMRHAAWN
jgi:hypothetical protein